MIQIISVLLIYVLIYLIVSAWIKFSNENTVKNLYKKYETKQSANSRN